MVRRLLINILLSSLLIFPAATTKDQEGINHHHHRKKRYSIEGSYWGANVITYRLKQPSRKMSLSQQKAVFAKAFAEEKTRLRFIYQDTYSKPANIEIVFASGDHQDGEPFDGRGSILAHAFFPRYGGSVHFDEDESWSANKTNGVDLYAVAVHEIGHALGLKHSFNDLSIMAPFYKQYSGNMMHLHNDDIMAISRLYGSLEVTPNKTTFSKKWKDKICENPYLDAVTKLWNGTILAFRGNSFFEIKPFGEVSSPTDISWFFPFEGPIDAATTDKNGNIYIFKDNLYWILTKRGNVMPNYPKKISVGLADTPDDLSAALHYEDGKPYFFKKSRYWQYSRHGLKKSWPRGLLSIFDYKNFPLEIDAAFHFDRNVSFIFHKNRYWKVSGNPMKVLPNYPRSLSKDWFKCSN